MCTRKWTASGWHCNFITKTLHCSLTILNTSHKGTPSLVLQARYMKGILCSDWLSKQGRLTNPWNYQLHSNKNNFSSGHVTNPFLGKGCLFNKLGLVWSFFVFFEIDQYPTIILTLICLWCLDYNENILDIFEKLMASLPSRNLLYSVNLRSGVIIIIIIIIIIFCFFAPLARKQIIETKGEGMIAG